MKLETEIKPNGKGIVLVEFGKDKYTFKAEQEGGALVCTVDKDDHVDHLLNLGTFFPADEADFARAARRVKRDEEQDEDKDDDEGEESMDAMPLEANTPPKPARARAKKGA